MEIIKKYIVGIVLLIVVAILWVGISLISERVFSEVNPNASTYTKPLQKDFDLETLENISKRTTSSFPVLPSEFFNLDTD